MTNERAEETVVDVVKDVLGKKQVFIDDTFEQHGADSLDTAEIELKLNERLIVSIDPNVLPSMRLQQVADLFFDELNFEGIGC